MTNNILDNDLIDDFPPLPLQVRSKDGQNIDLRGAVWTISASSDGGKQIRIDWGAIAKPKGSVVLTLRAWRIYQHYIAYCIERKKGCTIQCQVACLSSLMRWMDGAAAEVGDTMPTIRHLDWSTFDERLARGFLNWSITNRAARGGDFSRLRVFYAWGVARQYDDFKPHVLRALQSIRAPGGLKGQHVRFRDAYLGPLSPEERQLLVDAIKKGHGTSRDRAITMLHLELGINPQATVRMKNKDYKQISAHKGTFYQLDVPRVKKRTAYRETKRRSISNDLGQLLSELQQGGPDDPLFFWLNPRNPEGAITEAIKRFVKTAGILSPRTGQSLQMSARRLRYTLATDMAEDGASKFHIAEILDHTDLQHVDVYVETTSTIADHVAAATDGALLPLVRRFQGRMIETTEEQVVPDQPNQIIPAVVPHLAISLLNTAGLGVCGRSLRHDGLCNKYPPLSCYVCPSFVALRSGPHQEMFDSVEAFLHAQAETTDKRILNQLDEVRASIRDLIDRTAISDMSQTGS